MEKKGRCKRVEKARRPKHKQKLMKVVKKRTFAAALEKLDK